MKRRNWEFRQLFFFSLFGWYQTHGCYKREKVNYQNFFRSWACPKGLKPRPKEKGQKRQFFNPFPALFFVLTWIAKTIFLTLTNSLHFSTAAAAAVTAPNRRACNLRAWLCRLPLWRRPRHLLLLHPVPTHARKEECRHVRTARKMTCAKFSIIVKQHLMLPYLSISTFFFFASQNNRLFFLAANWNSDPAVLILRLRNVCENMHSIQTHARTHTCVNEKESIA